MAFTVRAVAPDEHEAWLAERRATSPQDTEGLAVFLNNGCGAVTLFPARPRMVVSVQNLTAFGERSTLAAGTLPHTVEDIARFVAYPGVIKPGVKMPHFGMLPEDDIKTIAVFLRSSSDGGARQFSRRGEGGAGGAVAQGVEDAGGWRYWTSVNNSEIGLWYGVTAFAFMLFAGLLGLLMRAQLAVPNNDLISSELFNQALYPARNGDDFLFAVPIFEAIAIFLLPSMLGARELPFPRLSAFGYWSFLLGGIFVCGSIFSMRHPMPAGSCTRRSLPTRNMPASAPISGCSACPSLKWPRLLPPSRSSSAS